MVPQKTSTQEEDDFAKKCRIALEKSWGMPIPKPKFTLKNDQTY